MGGVRILLSQDIVVFIEGLLLQYIDTTQRDGSY